MNILICIIGYCLCGISTVILENKFEPFPEDDMSPPVCVFIMWPGIALLGIVVSFGWVLGKFLTYIK